MKKTKPDIISTIEAEDIELKKRGNSFWACCPFHQDENPSFKVDSDKQTYHCFGCGAHGDVIDFIQELGGLSFKDALTYLGMQNGYSSRKDPEARRLVCTYDYTDESGKLLFQVCRYEPKDFRQRRPNGNGGWIYNNEGVRRVIYHLPKVIKSDEVLLVEGEKSVERLEALGFCATCSPMGAGKWCDEYSTYLRDKRVILIPDNDEPGRNHMHQVAKSLTAIAASIKWLELPDLPDKGDVYDFISHINDPEAAAEKLSQMIEDAEQYKTSIERLAGEHIKESNGLELPRELMTGTAGDFARLYGQYLEAPPEFFYFGFLTILGATLSGRLTLESELRPEPRFFTVLLGQSADERKSTAINKTVSFFQEFFPSSINYCFGIGSAEGLQARLKEIESGKLILVFDELKQLVSKCKIEGSVLLPCINTLFESDRYESRTKNTNIKLENIRLSFIGASTVQTYENMWTPQFLDIGFNNRLFLVPGQGERKNPIPRKVPTAEKQVVANQVGSILEKTANVLEVSFTDTATEAYNNWYFNLERSIHARRIDTYCMRLLPLLAINDHKNEIDVETVFKATAIMDWQLMVRGQLDPIDATNKIAQMEEKIRRKLKLEPMTKRQLQRAVNANRDGSWVFNTALKNLKEEIRFNRWAKCYEMVSI